LRSLSWHHGRILETIPDPDRHATETAQGMLAHAETQFQSTSLRLKGLEKRMDNIIALACLVPLLIVIQGKAKEH
jgi:hypothetical protein